MKNLRINQKKVKSLIAAGLILTTAGSLTGCIYTEIPYDATADYDFIDTNNDEVKIEPQVLDVPGEEFKLVVEYYLDDVTSKKWRVTDNKKIYTKVYTQGLEEGKKVYIDNVHTDTSIVSTKETMNGITQDSMDDRIHNSLMYGFPISDTVYFYAVNEIEGQNDTFIRGSSLGFNGYSSGTIEEERYTETDYLSGGVYANKIASVYGLLIQSGDEEPYGVDVSSDVLVLVSNVVEYNYEDGSKVIRIYNRDGSYSKETVKVKTK